MQKKKVIRYSVISSLLVIICLLCTAYFFSDTLSVQHYVRTGAVVRVQTQLYNTDALESFFHSADNTENAALRVVNYTVEGDPIIYDVTVQQQGYEVKIDTSHDKHGERSKQSFVFDHKDVLTNEQGTCYYFYNDSFNDFEKEASDSERLELLWIP